MPGPPRMPLAALGETCPRAPRGRGGHGTSAPKQRDMTSVREGSAGPPVGPSCRTPRSSPAPLPLPAPPLVTAGPEGWRPGTPARRRHLRRATRQPCPWSHASHIPGEHRANGPSTSLSLSSRRTHGKACGQQPTAAGRGQCGSRAHPPRFPGVSGGGRAVDGRERGRAGRADGARPAGWPWAVAEHIAASALSACCAPHSAGDPSTPGAGKAFVGPCEEGPPW